MAAKLDITLPFSDNTSFFQVLYSNCGDIAHTYIPWECTLNKKKLCPDISKNFEDNVVNSLSTADELTTVTFTRFKKKVQFDKSGQILSDKNNQPVKRLVQVNENVTDRFSN